MPIFLPLAIKKGLPIRRGHDHYWSVIMDIADQGHPITVDGIHARSSADRRSIATFVRKLEKAGLIKPLASGIGYQAVVKQSSAPRLRGDGTVIESQPARRCMWNYMRGPLARSGFSAVDLVNWSQTDETRIVLASANGYVRYLFDAGYLILLKAGKPGSPALYRLDPKMIKGPEAPMILQSKFVYDPNSKEIYGDATAEEVVA